MYQNRKLLTILCNLKCIHKRGKRWGFRKIARRSIIAAFHKRTRFIYSTTNNAFYLIKCLVSHEAESEWISRSILSIDQCNKDKKVQWMIAFKWVPSIIDSFDQMLWRKILCCLWFKVFKICLVLYIILDPLESFITSMSRIARTPRCNQSTFPSLAWLLRNPEFLNVGVLARSFSWSSSFLPKLCFESCVIKTQIEVVILLAWHFVNQTHN